MGSLLARIAIHRAIGLYLGEREIVVSRVAMLHRPVEIGRHCEPCQPDDLADALARAIKPFRGRKGRPVLAAVGIPASRVFLGTRPMRSASGDVSPEALLQKALQSPSIVVDDLIADLVRTDLNKLPLASIAACRKKYLSGLMEAFAQCGVRPCGVEPAPCALVRAAAHVHRTPRRAKTVLRVFLDNAQGLAVLVAADVPIAWRSFEFSAGREGSAVLCAARTLQTLSKHYGIESPLDAAMIHGRGDLHERLREEALADELGTRVTWHDEPGLGAPQIAFGLALGRLSHRGRMFDLVRTLKPRPSLRELFPWGELALQAALIVCMGLLMSLRSSSLGDSLRGAQAESRRHECLALAKPGQLEKEKADLQARVDMVHRFLQSRVLWSAYTHDIPARLPKSALLNTFHGLAELEYFGKKKEGVSTPKKSLVLRATAPIMPDGSTPREIDAFLESLRNHPLLQRDFPVVELADIRRYQLHSAAQPMANFHIVCLPKAAKTPDSSADGEAGKRRKKEDK